jgi:predicted cupin superfamily sugar epimerase
MHPRAARLIRELALAPHPEGGSFREIFRSTTDVTPADGRPRRGAVTTIYFLLAEGQWSRWHAVRSDELWHFYEGDPLELLVASADARTLSRLVLRPLATEGPRLSDDGRPVHVVPAGCWQAARPLGAYSLVGCTVAPGFEYDDFRMLADDPEAAQSLHETAADLALLL